MGEGEPRNRVELEPLHNTVDVWSPHFSYIIQFSDVGRKNTQAGHYIL